MIYKVKVEGHKYPIRINTALIPIMYIRKIEKNWYELAIVGTPGSTDLHHHYFTINALENRSFIEFMGGEKQKNDFLYNCYCYYYYVQYLSIC